MKPAYLITHRSNTSAAGIGCHIGNFYVDTLAYADDVVLIAPTASAMRKMLAICDSFAIEYCVSFNAFNANLSLNV